MPSKNSNIFVFKLGKLYDKQVIDAGREFQILRPWSVENCKLLKIHTTRIQSIIAGCSSAIVMHLTTCYKQIEKDWRQQLIKIIMIIKHIFVHLKCVDLKLKYLR